MEARAISKYNRVSTRKTRLVADLIRGKTVKEAYAILAGINTKGSRIIYKTLKSAVANYIDKFKTGEEESLVISEILIDKGPTLKRFRPRAQGRAFPILKPTTHVKIVVKSTNN